MNADWPSLATRARMHAALADPARLSIVDMLCLGDMSPGEIAVRLGMPSNLVAHHVGFLRREGPVTGTRSEGDRRRTYLRLTSCVPADPHVAPAYSPRRVVFVCTRNTARSQLAAALWTRESSIGAISAGTDPAPAVHEQTIAAARRHGLTLRSTVTRHVAQVARHQDLLVAVCDNAHEQLPGTTLDRLHWSVPDPVPDGSDAAFDRAVADLVVRISNLAPALVPGRR